MWPFRKPKPDWKACPDWRDRYDFVVKGTVDRSPAKARPHIVSAPYEPSRPVLYYHRIRFRSTTHRLRAALRGQKYRFHFTAFVYDEPELGQCTVAREELCQAFTALVQAWHKFLRHYAEFEYACNTYPFKGSPSKSAQLEDIADILTGGEGLGRFCVLVPDTWLRLLSAANYFGQYLNFLSDMEDRGKLPPGWRRYPGPMEEASVRLKATGCYRMKVCKGTIDDYVFRATRIINSDKPSSLPEVDETLELLRDMTRRALRYKGYSDENIDGIFAEAEDCPTSFVLHTRLLDVVPSRTRKPWEKYFDRVDPGSEPAKQRPSALPATPLESACSRKSDLAPPPYIWRDL